MTFIVNELCQRMPNPNQQSLAKLKRLARYLKPERQWGQIVGYGRFSQTRIGHVARKQSSSAGVIMLGDHALKACTRKQNIKARSVAEAELYAAALEASESKGIVSLLRDLGCEMKPVPLMRKPLNTSSTGKELGN